MTRHATILTSAAALVLLCVAAPSRAQQTPAHSARAKELGKRVKCMCGGCNDAAGSCYHSGGTFSGPCPKALEMLTNIDAQVASGASDDAILKSAVQEYGPTVLIEPSKSGFNLAAWIMPVLVPLIALFAVWETVRKWRHRGEQTPAAERGTVGAPSRELLDRVQREIGKD